MSDSIYHMTVNNFLKSRVLHEHARFCYITLPKSVNHYIGIKHDFLCINICWNPRVVLKHEPERRRFLRLPRVLADLFGRYYCISLQTLERRLGKFCITYAL